MPSPQALSRRRFLRTTSLGLAAAALGVRRLGAADTATATLPFRANEALASPAESFSRTLAALHRGMENGLHIGAQIYVSRDGKPIGDFAMGEARPGVKMTPGTLMTWFSSTKPLTAMCVAQCWERGKLDLDDPVAKHLPEFARHGKEAVTIRHVLTHTSGFPNVDLAMRFKRPFDEVVAAICEAKLEPGWEPGKYALYHPTSEWYILGAVVARVAGRPFDEYIRRELFEPLEMNDCWVGMPATRFRAYGDRVGVMMDTDKGKPVESGVSEGIGLESWATLCIPGGNGHGPMRELGRFYEMMLGGGVLGERRVLSQKSIDTFTAIHRKDVPTWQTNAPAPLWGLGFVRARTVGGVHASARTFGHGGSASSIAFGDPEKGVVAALVCNGRCKPPEHSARIRELTAAVYEDLGLASKG